MASRSRTPDTLFTLPTESRPSRGRHERRTDDAIKAARSRALLGPEHDALVTTLRALSRSLDAAERAEQPYAVATVARELRACLTEAGMTPGKATASDGFADLMAALSEDAAP